ncbi:MAG TPA: hypothetical protein VKA46_00560 [Gemmataceae bacterium]|nr:hypothetical protein [Gemmataceae bacterium]
MDLAVFPELTRLRTLVKRAKLVADAEHSVLWCLDQLPKLYADFCRTDESRFGDAILRLASAVLKKLAETSLGTGAGRVGDALVAQLGRLHERLGLAPLALKPAPTTASGRKKKSA